MHQNEFILTVLENLNVIDTGQPVAAEDRATIMRRLGPTVEDLNARDVCYVDDIDNIRDDMALPLADIMAWKCASAFNITDATKLSMLQKAGDKDGDAEQTLRDVVRLRSDRQTMRVERFTRSGYRRR